MKKIMIILISLLTVFMLLTCEIVPTLEELPHDNPLDPQSPDYVDSVLTVTYDAFDSSGGTVPVDTVEYQSGDIVTVIGNTGDLTGPVIRDGIRQLFVSWNTKDDGTGTAYDGDDTFTITEDTTLYAMYTKDTGIMRKMGPAGGWVFYDKGSYSDQWRYLEAAPEDQSTSQEWSNIHDTAVPGTYTAVGYGNGNTINMVTQDNTAGFAGTICASHEKNHGGTTYDYWFLPSRDELALMYANLHNQATPVGDFGSVYYWSSSEDSSNDARWHSFSSGSQGSNSKGNGYRVRAVRSFTSSDSYQLRDRGPADGWIFYREDNGTGTWTYLEAEDQDFPIGSAAATYHWSNVTDTLVPLGEITGTGKSNTLYIIAQPGHTESAAQVCGDYTLNGYNDWFLPSKDELNLMYVNLRLESVGGFGSDYYWSSSEVDSNLVNRQYFDDGDQGFNNKDIDSRVRAARAF